jgi:NitT/TauT family transport system ATP-binding protein
VAGGGVSATLEHVRRSFGAREVVADCTLDLEGGRVTAMIGPSGCGKSTIAFLLAGYDAPDGGRVLVDGAPVAGPSPDRLLVFQESALMPWLTTLENVMFGPRARGERRRDAEPRARALLARVGLAAFADRYPAQLSGGMQRRAELARALINDPAVMILDEPFRGLDAMTRRLMQEYCAALLEESPRTTLFITTDIDEAIFLADRLLIMANRPTNVRRSLEVPLARPRDRAAVLRDPTARALKAEALELLHQEARRSFHEIGEPA